MLYVGAVPSGRFNYESKVPIVLNFEQKLGVMKGVLGSYKKFCVLLFIFQGRVWNICPNEYHFSFLCSEKRVMHDEFGRRNFYRQQIRNFSLTFQELCVKVFAKRINTENSRNLGLRAHSCRNFLCVAGRNFHVLIFKIRNLFWEQIKTHSNGYFKRFL